MKKRKNKNVKSIKESKEMNWNDRNSWELKHKRSLIGKKKSLRKYKQKQW